MGDNIPDDDDEEPETHADRLFSFLRLWGLAECMLDMCNARILHQIDTRKPRARFPVTLEKKLTYYVEAHEHIPELNGFLPYAREISGRFTAEKELRNTIVHGAPLAYDENGTVHFMQLRPHKGEPRYRYRKVTPKDWDRLERTCLELSYYLVVSTVGISNILRERALDQGYEPPSEGMMEFPGDLPIPKRIREFLNETLAMFSRHQLSSIGGV